MKQFLKISIIVGIVISSLTVFLPVKAQELSQSISLAGSPPLNSLSGPNKGNISSFEIQFDLTQIPTQSSIETATLSFEQDKVASGILKIIDKNSGEAPDLFSLGSKGIRSSTNFSTLVSNWVSKPSTYSGLLFQAYQLDNNDYITISNIKLDVTYRIMDVVSPVITAHQIVENSDIHILLKWQSDEPTKGFIKYGKTVNYGQQSDSTLILGTDNSIMLINLTPGITYHYKLFVEDASGNKTETLDNTFQTKLPNSVSDNNTLDNSVLPSPKNFIAIAVEDNGSFHNLLTWSMLPSSEVNGYVLFKKTDSNESEELVVLNQNIIEFIDYKVEFGHKYTYFIRSYNGSQLSPPSPEQSITISANGDVLGADTKNGTNKKSDFYKILVIFGILIFWFLLVYNFYKRLQKEFEHKKGLENVLKNPEYYSNEFERDVVSNT